MLDHKSKMHSNLIDKYCRFCKNTFSTKGNLIEHMKRVHDSDDVNKAFIRMANGDSIFIVAEDVKDFSDTFDHKDTKIPEQISCITCKKRFQNKELAEKHILTCNFCCDICQKSFKQKQTLTRHASSNQQSNVMIVRKNLIRRETLRNT